MCISYWSSVGCSSVRAVDRVDPPGGSPGVGDPAAPDPDAVAAARARRGDPIETIKADVDARLAQKQKRPAATDPADGVAHEPSVTAPPAPLLHSRDDRKSVV